MVKKIVDLMEGEVTLESEKVFQKLYLFSFSLRAERAENFENLGQKGDFLMESSGFALGGLIFH